MIFTNKMLVGELFLRSSCHFLKNSNNFSVLAGSLKDCIPLNTSFDSFSIAKKNKSQNHSSFSVSNYFHNFQYNIQNSDSKSYEKWVNSKKNSYPFKLHNSKCTKTNYELNRLDNRLVLFQYTANDPIEDRFAYAQIKSLPGYFLTVLDGHGGPQIADYTMANLPKKFENFLKANISKDNKEELIYQAFRSVFDEIENELFELALQDSTYGTCGCCALAVFVHNNKCYTANVGDSQGIICKTNDDQSNFNLLNINEKLNVNSRKEREKLMKKFPFEDDIVTFKEKSNSKTYYIKNTLQPTRAFGDFFLKHQSFYKTNKKFCQKIFNGPYITHEPDIKTYNLNQFDRYLILGSDGFWDEITEKEIINIVKKGNNDLKKITENLFIESLQNISKRKNITEEQLIKIPIGYRRRVHDDITLIGLDLMNQN